MARFNTSAAQSNQAQDDSWKAVFYINVTLPIKKKDGTVGDFKLGEVGLAINSKAPNATLLKMYSDNPEKLLALIQEHAKFELRSAVSTAAPVEFAFSL